MIEYYIDLGSSTIKVYQLEESLKLQEEHSIYFKNDFTKEKGISEENRKELFEYFRKLKQKYQMNYENTHIYVTGIFRELTSMQKRELVKRFHDEFGLHFNIISHGIENYYLGESLKNDYNNKKVLVINMGGKTTELVMFEQNKIVERKNLKIGVADLLNKFPEANEAISKVRIAEIETFVKSKLGDLSLNQDYDCAIFTGGEERFELLTGYPLVKNTLFQDGIHKYMISTEEYVRATEKVFFKITLEQLYALMPQNPKWMDGARLGAILPLAIFHLANVPIIVPSDLNLINGVINDQKINYFGKPQ